MYGREIDGQVLTMQASGWTWNDAFVLWDQETGSIWWGGAGDAERDLVCIGGYWRDRELEKVYYARTIWRNWKTMFPHTKIMKAK